MKKSKKKTFTPRDRLREIKLRNQQLLHELILDYIHLRSLVINSQKKTP